MKIREQMGLSFDDVLLVPKRGILEKREMANIGSEVVPGLKVDIPIISAPMQSVTEADMALWMLMEGGFGILHRFMTIEEQQKAFLKVVKVIHTWGSNPAPCGAAIGINEGYERWEKLLDVGCNVLCLDVAHAHHDSIETFIRNAGKDLVSSTHLIVGNVATAQGALFLAELGVAAVKVGIGPGAACTTREVTGFGYPQLSAIDEVYKAFNPSTAATPMPTKIIADGGIRNSGDIVKALAAGANTVMVGRLLAGADESPHPGLYWGMASHRVNGHHAPEGIEGVVERTGSLKNTLKPLTWGIRSGISYAGASDLQGLRANAEFVRVSSLAQNESGTRV